MVVVAAVVVDADRDNGSRDDQETEVHDEVTSTSAVGMFEARGEGPLERAEGRGSVVAEVGGCSNHDEVGSDADAEAEVVPDGNMRDGVGIPVGSSHNGLVVAAAVGAPLSLLVAETALLNVQEY